MTSTTARTVVAGPRHRAQGRTVVDATGERRGRRGHLRRARSSAVGPDLVRRAARSTRAAASSSPGLVDLHTHLRQPGKEEAETIESGSRAAALGGYTAVLAMPNTTPTIDCAAVVREVLELGTQGARATCISSGAITVGPGRGASSHRWPRWPTLGVRIFTDDGTGVQDDRLMRRALEYASGPRRHAGPALRGRRRSREGTCMHEGEWSSRLGLPGQPSEAEELMVMRDIALARLTGARMHFLHLSTAGLGRHGRRGPRPAACRSRPRRRRTTSR